MTKLHDEGNVLLKRLRTLDVKLAQSLETHADDTSLIDDEHTLDLMRAHVVEMKEQTIVMKTSLHAAQCLLTRLAKWCCISFLPTS